MRITYKPVKRVTPPHEQVSSLIATLLDTPVEELADVIESVQSWRYPRSDLHSWISVLNRFDDIYENIIQEYDLSKLQNNPFSSDVKVLLLACLRFQRMLLDNSTNRKLYNSYDKLNLILSTSDLDVLISVLQLILRPAQQYSAQPSVAQALRVSPTKFQAMARQWPIFLENGVSLVDLASPGTSEIIAVESLPAECSDLTFTFYRRDSSSMDAVQATGPTTIFLNSLAESSQDPYEILSAAIHTYHIPVEEQFDLLSRIRACWIMGKGRTDQRIKLVIVRLLALAIFAHTHQESEAHSCLLMYEPDIIGHISELLQLGKDIPISVRTAALAALDSLARYRGRTQDVLSGVNAGVNHGLLMSLLRRTVVDMADPQNDLPQSFTEALLSFISFLATHTAGGNMLIGAGIIPLLIQVTKVELPNRLAVVSKTMTLIDNVLYGYPNAFQIFVGSGGVKVIVDRIKHEVDVDLEVISAGGLASSSTTLSILRSSLLKHLLRSIHRLMHSSGTTEGLRGLIDSSLVKSITRIMENRALFGPTVLPLAINIMTTFIHNEPTSLHVLQEARVPDVFYSVIESGLEPVMEVIQSVPNALGALCLNQAGSSQLAERSQVIDNFFDIFTSEKHVKLLQDKDNAVIVGSTIDELVRHHPALSDRVFSSIARTLDNIEASGIKYVEEPDQTHLYRLSAQGTIIAEAGSDLALESDIISNGPSEKIRGETEDTGDQTISRKVENPVISSLDVFSRFLEGLFQQVHHCKDFIDKSDGLTRLSRILALPCLPYDFGVSIGSDALVQVMRSLVEASPVTTLTSLAKQVLISVRETESQWKHSTEISQMFHLLELNPEHILEANSHFRSLVTLHIRISTLTDVCQIAGYSQGRAVNVVLQTLTSSELQELIPALGDLHRHSVWEHLNLSRQLNAKGLGHLSRAPMDHPTGSQIATPSEDIDLSINNLALPLQPSETNVGEANIAISDNNNNSSVEEAIIPKQNAKALMHIASELPKTLKKFFNAVVRMFLFSRRAPDLAQKEQATRSADMIATILYQHLTFPVEENEIAYALAYEAVVLRLISSLLYDDRTSDWSLHTGLLLALMRKGVLNAIVEVVNRCMRAVSRLSSIESGVRTEVEATQLLRAITCLKIAIKLLSSIASIKYLTESTQTPFNMTPGKQPSEVNYFEPHDLICRIRLVVLPVFRDLWRSSWLGTVANILSRDVVQAVIELLEAEGETPTHNEARPSGSTEIRSNRAPEPDEDRIQQLCDMGFPRSAAARALQRTSNNISAATEYLLAHPLPFPPDTQQQEIVSGEAQESTPLAGDDEINDNSSEHHIIQDQGTSETVAKLVPALSEVVTELNNLRDPLRADFGQIALSLLDRNPDLIFVFRSVFVDEDWKTKNLQVVLDDIRAFAPSAHDIYELPLVHRFRLLALVFSNSPTPSLKEHELKGLIAHCLALLLANPVSSSSNASTPRWLAPLLLVVHSLFIKGEEFRDVADPLRDQSNEEETLLLGPIYKESRPLIFNFCLRVLSLPTATSDELHATLQLLVHLTRDPSLAKEYWTRGGFKLALEVLRQHTDHKAHYRVQIALLLRHVVEDTETIKSILRYEIVRRFSPGSRTLDVKGLMRHFSSIALRNPRLFLQTAESLCELLPTDLSFEQLSLKKDGALSASQGAMQVDERLPTSSETEALIQSIVTALLECGRSAVEYTINLNSRSIAESINPQGDAAETIKRDKEKSQEGYIQYSTSYFLMQILAELLLSYDRCKSVFVALSKKKSGDLTSKDTKYNRPTILNFLITEIVCYSSLTRPDSADGRKRALLSQGAMSIILALCVDSMPYKLDSKDIPAELTSTRKFVLDVIIKALKENAVISAIETRYGKLASLADLLHRLLMLRSTFGPTKERDETPLQMAKLMLEKNLVSILTGALTDVDPNYPGARSLVNNILRPLEHLTKVAIKMARPLGQRSEEEPSGGDSQEGSESSSEGDHLASEERQETPDIYRNSALGIYGGEMEEANYDGEDEEMLNGEEGAEEDDMDLDYDEVDTDSENTSEDMDDVGAEEEPIPREGMAPEGWHESDEGADERVEMLSADDVPDDEVIPDGEDVWQDMQIHEEFDADDDNESGEGHDALAVGAPEDIDNDDGMDDQSEDIAGNLELIEDGDDPNSAHDQVFERELTQWFEVGAGTGNEREVYLRSNRRRVGGDINQNPLFGTPRLTGASNQVSLTHPLLVEPTVDSSSREHPATTQRILQDSHSGNIVASIEELVGAGALQFFQQLLSRSGARGEIFGLEVPSAGIVATVGRSGNLHRHAHTLTVSNDRSNKESTDDNDAFSLAPTSVRWSDEVKITQGGSEMSRATRLGHILVSDLIPAAKQALARIEEAEKQHKEEEEEKARQQELSKPRETELETSTEQNDDRGENESQSSVTGEAPQVQPRPISPATSNRLIDNAAHAMQGISVTDDMGAAEDLPRDDEAQHHSSDHEPPHTPVPGPSRIHVQIHGTAVDITDTGIDPAFLEALPDDMREEVLAQQLREQRGAIAASQQLQVHESQINPEFLEALPPEIRAELLDQEAEQARRRANQAVQQVPIASSGPVDMDSATFLASLDPGLRQVVLMEQDETFLETLPPALLAEVTHYRDTDRNRLSQSRQVREEANTEITGIRKPGPARDSIHLLDKSGVSTLIRLLFYPQVLRKNTLQKVFVNICENSKTRVEVYHSILGILLENSHLDEKHGEATPQKLNRNLPLSVRAAAKKSASLHDTSTALGPISRAVLESGLTPQLILQRCIEMLNEITSASDSSPIFFLTEQERPSSWKKGSSKKAKGKERSHTSYYPLSLLLSLLESPIFLKNSGMMDSLVSLLAVVTRPLITGLPRDSISSVKETEGANPRSDVEHPSQMSRQDAIDSNPLPVQETTDSKTTDLPAKPEEAAVSLLVGSPAISPSSSRLVVNILTAGDCSGRTFQHCLALIQHLSCIPDAKTAIVKELQMRVHGLGQFLLADLMGLISAFSPILGTVSDFPNHFATKFSLPSADQAKLLRILKTIEYLYTDKTIAASSINQDVTQPGEEDILEITKIYRTFELDSVWQCLSDFLRLLHEREDIGDNATLLLPLIESLMVVCKHTGVGLPEANSIASQSPDSGVKLDLFVTFTDAHRKVLNQMVRSNPSLMSGSFSLLVKNPRVLDFDNKRNYFTQQLRRRQQPREHFSTLTLNVRRARVFEDSYQYLQRKSGEQIKYGKLAIRFYNEEGVDAGGVTREWFTILARQMFNPDYALFQPCAADKLTYQPNRASNVNPEHLSFFKFVGRIIGKAIFDGRLLDAYFARSLFRQLLGKPVDYRDVEWVDPEYYKSLIWILENDPAPLDLTFIVEDSQFGVTTIVPLKENGENVAVNQENKREYVQLSAEFRLVKSIKEQIDALLGGFYEIIPKSLISIFNEQEVELLIAGTPDVDVDEWRAATDYHGYTSSDPVISWWWRALKSFNREEKAKLLGFATGTTRVPLGGFTELQGVQGVQRFSIHKAYGDPNRLPQAHTCFNQIDLPEYTSYEKLRASLLTAIYEGSTGFGFA